MFDPYARYTRLKFDRPHPKVLRVTMDNGRMNTADDAMHAELADIWHDIDRDDSINVAWTTVGAPDTLSETVYHGHLFIEDNDNAEAGVRAHKHPVVNDLRFFSLKDGEWRRLRAEARERIVLAARADPQTVDEDEKHGHATDK